MSQGYFNKKPPWMKSGFTWSVSTGANVGSQKVKLHHQLHVKIGLERSRDLCLVNFEVDLHSELCPPNSRAINAKFYCEPPRASLYALKGNHTTLIYRKRPLFQYDSSKALTAKNTTEKLYKLEAIIAPNIRHLWKDYLARRSSGMTVFCEARLIMCFMPHFAQMITRKLQMAEQN
ncbi:hypothetical protein KIN20_032454 [Parelaphostrongylus tenuis]|uniref:Uncharacterized protein n=1 Tax=Parelaphostrongylus tenuis TaxID=148309 RepID=A0AAD5R745_PARTN|nr:hypothetical protein KIN20_032454 [Parelaphostrongylus tenuis]